MTSTRSTFTDADVARWLRACLPPDQPERIARLDAGIRSPTATAPPLLLSGDAAELLPDAVARVPANALPVVTTTWALSQFSRETRQRFFRRIEEAAAGRAVAWVSSRRGRVAPTIPTLGDRPASGHSIIGLAVFGLLANPPKPSAAAGHGATSWSGWQTARCLAGRWRMIAAWTFQRLSRSTTRGGRRCLSGCVTVSTRRWPASRT